MENNSSCSVFNGSLINGKHDTLNTTSNTNTFFCESSYIPLQPVNVDAAANTGGTCPTVMLVTRRMWYFKMQRYLVAYSWCNKSRYIYSYHSSFIRMMEMVTSFISENCAVAGKRSSLVMKELSIANIWFRSSMHSIVKRFTMLGRHV